MSTPVWLVFVGPTLLGMLVGILSNTGGAFEPIVKDIFQRFRTFNQRIADGINSAWAYFGFRIKTTAWGVARWECVGFGFTFMQIGEWLAAVALWVTMAAIGIGVGIASRIKRQKSSFGLFASVAWWISLAILLVVVTVERKPTNEPWSNLQKLAILGKYRYSPVSISPSVVNFHKDTGLRYSGGETSRFVVTNNDDRDTYKVATQFLIEFEQPGNDYNLWVDDAHTPVLIQGCMTRSVDLFFWFCSIKLARVSRSN